MAISRRALLQAVLASAAAPLFAGGVVLAAPAGRPFKLVMLGDSLIEGYGLKPSQAVPAQLQAALAARGVPIDIINAGVSGETSADVLARLDGAVPADANGVIIAVGANDMLQLLPPEDLEANLRAMLDRLRSLGVMTALAGMRLPWFLSGPYQQAFDAVFPAVARAYKAPLYPYLLSGVFLQPELNLEDGIHPNAAGAKVIAQKLAPFTMSAFGLRAG
ncbi:MAG: arylesterase [Caulobacterales bacterium]